VAAPANLPPVGSSSTCGAARGALAELPNSAEPARARARGDC